jgi:hypothetical protein
VCEKKGSFGGRLVGRRLANVPGRRGVASFPDKSEFIFAASKSGQIFPIPVVLKN